MTEQERQDLLDHEEEALLREATNYDGTDVRYQRIMQRLLEIRILKMSPEERQKLDEVKVDEMLRKIEDIISRLEEKEKKLDVKKHWWENDHIFRWVEFGSRTLTIILALIFAYSLESGGTIRTNLGRRILNIFKP